MQLTDKITLTCEDNMELMSRYADDHFHLAVVDPEYGIGEAGKNHKSRNTLVRQKDGVTMRRCPSTEYSRKDWDDKPAGEEYFKELFRVSANQIVFGANYFETIMPVCKPPRRHEFEQFLLEHPTNFIIWDKVNGTSDFSDCELIWTSIPIKSYILPYMWAGMMQGVSIKEGTRMQGNKKLNEKRIHPTQKPVKIYSFLLNEYAEPHCRILDTHFGSGSIAVPAHYLDLELTACEKDQEYFYQSVQRLRKVVNQQKLF